MRGDPMTFDEYLGMEFSPGQETHESEIIIQPHHCNPTGNINGGVILSLADNLATGAANSAYHEKTGERRFMVGIDIHASMLANQQGGTIRAISRPIRVGRRVTVIRTSVYGEGDRLLADVTTTHVPG